MSHNYGNLLKRTVTVNLKHFLPGADEKFNELETFLNQADKSFTAEEVKKIKQTPDFPRSLNAFLKKLEPTDAQKDKILELRHTDFNSKPENEKDVLRGKIQKFRKIQAWFEAIL